MKPSSDVHPVGSVVTIGALSNEKFVVGKILHGGMGEVYQLLPVAIARPPLALKTYQQSANRERFIREAGIWISLGNQPHIARAFVYLEWEYKPSIISSWYKQPIDAKIARSWAAAKLTRFAAGLIDALQHALLVGHIIHQDVKPANILLDDSDEPRLADFGMARFSAAPAHTIRNILDVDSSMGHSVTLGPLGGTPLYMAPELFNGKPPSVQTDIFSLGVTLYEVLTGEHPYWGPETGHCLRPILRTGPLARVLEARGEELAPLIRLITAAVQVDTSKRPSSYETLAGMIGGTCDAQRVANQNEVCEVIVRAAFLRDTGRYEESLELLRTALSARPVNPELLNSYAIQLWKLGRKTEAYSSWKAAVESLKFTNGRHERNIYPDPAVNLAWRMVGDKQFGQANELLVLVNSWCQNAQHALYSYMEIGWWHLFNGRFEEAWNHILISGESKTTDELSLWSLTLAAWLSENFEHKVNTLAKFYSRVSNAGETTALVACAVATYCPEKSKANLLAIAYPKYEGRLASVAKEIGIESLDWRRTLPRSIVHHIFRSLDVMVTGGKNCGAI